MQTMKVKPWGEGQGDHVLINAADFDPAMHQTFDAPAAEAPAEGAPAEPEKPRAKPGPKPKVQPE